MRYSGKYLRVLRLEPKLKITRPILHVLHMWWLVICSVEQDQLSTFRMTSEPSCYPNICTRSDLEVRDVDFSCADIVLWGSR